MPLASAALLCLHLLAAAYWVGGMVLMHLAVRPAAVAVLEPPARLGFMTAALGRFLAGVALSIGVLLASGAALVALAGGLGAVHWSVHAMLALALAMVAIFARVRLGFYRRLRAAVAARDWPAAGAALNAIRRLVGVNLGFGVAVFGVAIIGRAL